LFIPEVVEEITDILEKLYDKNGKRTVSFKKTIIQPVIRDLFREMNIF